MSRTWEPLVHSLLAQVRAHPGRTAFLVGDEAISFGQFWQLISAIAVQLQRQGITAGDRVLLMGPNSPRWAAGYFAIHGIGATAVPIDADMPSAKVNWVAEDCEAAAAVVANDVLLGTLPRIDLRSLDESESSRGLDPVSRPEDVADLLYTSGTTGRKKGVVLTQANIAAAATNVNAFVQSTEADVEVVPLPLSHSFGLGRLRCMAQTGNTMALEAGMLNAARVLKRLLDVRATGLALVPAGFELLLRMTGRRLADARANLRYIEIGSAAMRPATKQLLMELLPQTRICHHYGLTEASRAAFCEYHVDCDALDSIGRASPNVEITVRDSEGQELPAGEIGEFAVRGGMVMQEYWKQPELTAATLRGGWLRTGDCGYKGRDGRLYLVGRQDDLINVGGLKVSPDEVEQALREHPQVADAACVGVTHPNGVTGQCVKAFLVSRDEVATTELVSWLRERLEEHKIPRLWEQVSCIPKTPNGKIQRHLLRVQKDAHGS